MFTFEQFQQAVLRTWNPNLSPSDGIHNAVYGLAGETGEYIDLLKKQMFHKVDMGYNEELKELGDILYYLTALCVLRGFSLEHVAFANKEKLEGRYPDGFTEGGGIRK